MPWLRFTADFPFHPRPNVTIMYRAGDEKLVKQTCVDQAIAKKRAVAIERPRNVTDEADNAGR